MTGDIIVTTPKGQMANAAAEAEDCKAHGGGCYFRKVPYIPHDCKIGNACFYVEDGFIRGFAVIDNIIRNGHFICETTSRDWGHGNFIQMRADSWKWIAPLPMRGFMGIQLFSFHYHDDDVKIIGGWLDSRPEAEKTADKL